MDEPLAIRPCQALCAWSAVDARPGDVDVLLRCGGCGSEWRASEAWTPIDADGRVPDAVAALRATPPETVRDAGGADAAGSAGS